MISEEIFPSLRSCWQIFFEFYFVNQRRKCGVCEGVWGCVGVWVCVAVSVVCEGGGWGVGMVHPQTYVSVDLQMSAVGLKI